jgi:hypothetical protein
MEGRWMLYGTFAPTPIELNPMGSEQVKYPLLKGSGWTVLFSGDLKSP